MITALTDDDKMPWGKYKGAKMHEVPVSYLHYLWTNGKEHDVDRCPVAAYISDNLNALKEEDEDRLW